MPCPYWVKYQRLILLFSLRFRRLWSPRAHSQYFNGRITITHTFISLILGSTRRHSFSARKFQVACGQVVFAKKRTKRRQSFVAACCHRGILQARAPGPNKAAARMMALIRTFRAADDIGAACCPRMHYFIALTASFRDDISRICHHEPKNSEIKFR